MNIMNNEGGTFFLPVFVNDNDDRLEGGKVSHDYYNVYVNEDYVGDKISVAQGDGEWQAIEDYLKLNNFHNYTITQEGNQVYIDVDDEEESEAIRDHLEVYTQIR